MKGVNSLNAYLSIINRLETEMTNTILKRQYWINLYEIGHKDQFVSCPGIALALIYPYFPDAKQDKRIGFNRSMAQNCELWKLVPGASCPNEASEKDHIWPYSLGGITDDRNRADLCERCNRGKSNTIVGYFPWENHTPNWVIEKIEKMRKHIGL